MGAISSKPCRRNEALAFIIDRIIRTGISPTHDEIGIELGVSGTRAKQLVGQLVDRGLVEKTAGAQRNLRVRDVTLARRLVEECLVRLGWTAAPALGELSCHFPQGQLPMLPAFDHLPDFQ